MKVLVTGNRNWTYEHVHIIYRELSKLPQGTIIIHGGAPGVDEIAGLIAKELGFVVRDYPARWDVFGRKAAGPIRNKAMIDLEHLPHEPIDLVLAFHEDISESRGTKNMIMLAHEAKLPVTLISS